MKRSRLFLGFTTACLAIAGVVAAKAYNHKQSAWYYTRVTTNGAQCTFLVQTGAQYNSSGSLQATAGNDFSSKLYTQKGSNNACLNLFKYTTIDN